MFPIKKKVLATIAIVLVVAMMAACSAPAQESVPNEAAKPQEQAGAQAPEVPNVQTPQDGQAPPAPNVQEPQDGQAPPAPNGQAPGRGRQGAGSMEGRGMGMGFDVSAIEDPERPAEDPAYVGTVVSSENGTLTVRVREYAASAQAPNAQTPTAPNAQGATDATPQNPEAGNPAPGFPAAEEKTFTLAAGFRVKQAEFTPPTAQSGDDQQSQTQQTQPQTPQMTLTQIQPIQLREGDSVVLWLDSAGNAAYAIASFGRGMGMGKGMATGGMMGDMKGNMQGNMPGNMQGNMPPMPGGGGQGGFSHGSGRGGRK